MHYLVFSVLKLIVAREKNSYGSLCITVVITQKNSFTDKKYDILENLAARTKTNTLRIELCFQLYTNLNKLF